MKSVQWKQFYQLYRTVIRGDEYNSARTKTTVQSLDPNEPSKRRALTDGNETRRYKTKGTLVTQQVADKMIQQQTKLAARAMISQKNHAEAVITTRHKVRKHIAVTTRSLFLHSSSQLAGILAKWISNSAEAVRWKLRWSNEAAIQQQGNVAQVMNAWQEILNEQLNAKLSITGACVQDEAKEHDMTGSYSNVQYQEYADFMPACHDVHLPVWQPNQNQAQIQSVLLWQKLRLLYNLHASSIWARII